MQTIFQKNYGGDEQEPIVNTEAVDIRDNIWRTINVPERCKTIPGMMKNIPRVATFAIDNTTTTSTQKSCVQYAVPIAATGEYAISIIMLLLSQESGNQVRYL